MNLVKPLGHPWVMGITPSPNKSFLFLLRLVGYQWQPLELLCCIGLNIVFTLLLGITGLKPTRLNLLLGLVLAMRSHRWAALLTNFLALPTKQKRYKSDTGQRGAPKIIWCLVGFFFNFCLDVFMSRIKLIKMDWKGVCQLGWYVGS